LVSIIDDLVFLAADTVRSSAYAQRMWQMGVAPRRTLIFGFPNKNYPPAPSRTPDSRDINTRTGDIMLPDVSIRIDDIARREGWNVDRISESSINARSILDWVADRNAGLVLYSGFGGQIVPADLIDRSPPIIHIHPGQIPQARGSTTIYYEILEKRVCHASVIRINSEIDSGPVLLNAQYPRPPKGVDIDHMYDNAVRADLLGRFLAHHLQGAQPLAPPATEGKVERTFYVIHPVLKHLAILSLDGSEPADPKTR
jgi:methionyl-tRNA formyltransferase